MLRPVIINLLKIEDMILKAAREKQRGAYKETTFQNTANLALRTVKAGRQWNNIFNVLKGKETISSEFRVQ